jgi:hypothetical protein
MNTYSHGLSAVLWSVISLAFLAVFLSPCYVLLPISLPYQVGIAGFCLHLNSEA